MDKREKAGLKDRHNVTGTAGDQYFHCEKSVYYYPLSDFVGNEILDRFANGKRGGGGWAGGVQDVEGLAPVHEGEILHEIAVGGHGLGAHARAAGFEVLR